MADVITRFKLETTQYDSALRNASKELAEFTNKASIAGKEFAKFADKNIDAAKSFGNIATSATNSKDKVKELVGAFNDVAKAYNNLTKEQQQSDFGKTLADSMQQLKVRISEAKKELYDLGNATKNVNAGGLFSGDKLSGMLQVFGGNMLTKAAGLAAGFAAEIGQCVKEGIELAKQGEGIRIAFERLGRGDILDGLRKATHGTVTDIELMKAAVKFNDFKLPIEELGTMLAFAQQKAKDTGQSVDYMVDSIVTGLGRKSLMILDNLGLSAAEVKEKMKETGDMTKAVGAIIRDQMAKAGDYVETAADKATQANVELKNAMEELGRTFQPLAESSNSLWKDMEIGALRVLNNAIKPLIDRITEAGRMRRELERMNGGQGGTRTKVDQQISALRGSSFQQQKYESTVRDYEREINQYEKDAEAIRKWQRGDRSDEVSRQIADYRKRSGNQQGALNLADLTAKIAASEKMLAEYKDRAKEVLSPTIKPEIDTSDAEQNLEKLKQKLVELKEQQKLAVLAGDEDKAKAIGKEISTVKANIKVLEPSTTTTTTASKSDREQAQNKFEQAEADYQQALEQIALEIKAKTISTAEAKKKELQASETLWKSIGDARQMYDTPTLKEEQEKVAQQVIELGGSVAELAEQERISKEASRQLEAAQKKLTEVLDEAANSYRENDLKGYISAMKKGGADPMQGIATGGFTYTDANLGAFTSQLKEQLASADLGTELYQNLTAQLADANALGNLMQIAIKNGIDVAQFNPQDLWKKIFCDKPGDYIDDTELQTIVDKINEYLKEHKIDPIKLNFSTGDTKGGGNTGGGETVAKYMNSIAGDMSSILSNMEQLGIKIPEGLKQVIGGIQAVTSILTTISAIVSTIQAFSAAGAIPLFAHGGIVHAANGFVPGNDHTDNIPVMVSSGELILNKAQQGNLASQLQNAGGNAGASAQPYVSGEQIYLGLNNYLRRSGMGELLTARR